MSRISRRHRAAGYPDTPARTEQEISTRGPQQQPDHPAAEALATISARDYTLEPITVTGGPVLLRIRSTDQQILTTLHTQLAPALQTLKPVDSNDFHDIFMVVDPSLTHGLNQTTGSTRSPNRMYQVCGGIHLASKQAGTGREHRSGFLLWSQANPRHSGIVLSHSGAAADTVLLRLVRGIAARILLAAGWIPLHAACVMTSAGAVCLLGGHGSGKTTALLHLLSDTDRPVALVANSLVFLNPDGPAEIRTFPMAVGLRAPTIDFFPALRQLAHDSNSYGRIYVPARTLATALDVDLCAGGQLAAFIDVIYRGAPRSIWSPLSEQDRGQALCAAHIANALADAPHEQPRLHAGYARDHQNRLLQVSEAVPAAKLESGRGTARVVRLGLTSLITYPAG